MRLLGALRPLEATWSGQVMSSRPAPSGGPFMTHLLPGGGVPQVHGARSPVPPRLPHFASPRSGRHLGTVVAGAYPPHRPPNTRSLRVPAPPGPCYWLVRSGTSTGWRGGCLAAGLVRSTVCYYCPGGCNALVECAPRSRQVWGVAAGADSHVSPLPPHLPPRSSQCVWRVVLSGCPFPSPAATKFHAICAFRGAQSGCPSGPRLVSVACLCTRAPRGSRPPPRVSVARAPRLVTVQGARRAVPGSLCPSTFPPLVPCSA